MIKDKRINLYFSGTNESDVIDFLDSQRSDKSYIKDLIYNDMISKKFKTTDLINKKSINIISKTRNEIKSVAKQIGVSENELLKVYVENFNKEVQK